jgi:hypothetical protein
VCTPGKGRRIAGTPLVSVETLNDHSGLTQEDVDAVVSRILDVPVSLQHLRRTASDDEIDALVKTSQFYANKYPDHDKY